LACRFIGCIDKLNQPEKHEAVAMLFGDAKDGSKLAMGALGYCYQTGTGVPQSNLDAYIWFNIAAAFGLNAAQDRDRLGDTFPPEQLIEAQQKAVQIFNTISEQLAAKSEGVMEMEDRNYPVQRTCPHCGSSDAKLMPPLGDYSEYQCLNCGTYRVSGSMEQLIANGVVDPRSAHIEKQNGHRCLVR